MPSLQGTDGVLEDRADRAGCRVGQVRGQRLGRRLAEQPEQGYQHQDPRKDGQDAVIRQRRGAVLQEVVLELPHGPPARGQPRASAEFRRLARGGRASCIRRGLVLGGRAGSLRCGLAAYRVWFGHDQAFFPCFPASSLLSSPGQVPVSEWVPCAAARFTAALTVAKIAPCNAAAMRISCQPRAASVAFGASSCLAASCHDFLKITLASKPPTIPASRLAALNMSLCIA